MCEFYSSDYQGIHIFVQRTGEEAGWLKLEGPDQILQQVDMGTDYYRMIGLELPKAGKYRLETEGVQIAQMYLTECDGLPERGIRYLDPETGQEIDLAEWYDTPWREQYHFGPFQNWLNDPNGLCWYQGWYHLFFQANPYGQEWNDMHWGHAVSRDLIHWTHMPFTLQPQPELWSDRERKGGAFSGSAAVLEDGIHFYLTRHDGPLEDGSSTREWQTESFSRDGIHMEWEKEIIREKPEGASFDFRDPKVVQIEGVWYLVLGSCIDNIPSILLYRKEEDGTWQYQGPLLTEMHPGIRTFECPDFFPLDGKFVASGAWMCNRDEAGRYQMTRCYVGDFDGEKLSAESQQWMDFGSNFYAAQSFEQDGRRIVIGWISDFYNEHRAVSQGAYGSYGLPRELSLKGNRVCMKPVKECYGLLGEAIPVNAQKGRVSQVRIPGNSYYVKVALQGNNDFRIVLAREGEDSLSLVRKDGVTGFVSTRKELDGVRFPSDVKDVREIEIFMDRRLTEVFLNGGEGAGAKLFYQDSTDGCLEAEFEETDLIQMEVRRVNTIWGEK